MKIRPSTWSPFNTTNLNLRRHYGLAPLPRSIKVRAIQDPAQSRFRLAPRPAWKNLAPIAIRRFEVLHHVKLLTAYPDAHLIGRLVYNWPRHDWYSLIYRPTSSADPGYFAVDENGRVSGPFQGASFTVLIDDRMYAQGLW